MLGLRSSSEGGQRSLRRVAGLGGWTWVLAAALPLGAVVVGTGLYLWRTSAVEVPVLVAAVPVQRESPPPDADAEVDYPPIDPAQPPTPPTPPAADVTPPAPAASPAPVVSSDVQPPQITTRSAPPPDAESTPEPDDADDPLVTDFFGVEVRRSDLDDND